MKIVVVGRGNVGGGLARLWQGAGHGVVSLGREGGDASGADVVVVAVPADAIPEALSKVTGSPARSRSMPPIPSQAPATGSRR